MSPEQQAQIEGVDAQRGAERSDAGIPRPKPAAAESGTLTREQVDELRVLIAQKYEADLRASEACDDAQLAADRLEEKLRSLTTKTGQQ